MFYPLYFIAKSFPSPFIKFPLVSEIKRIWKAFSSCRLCCALFSLLAASGISTNFHIFMRWIFCACFCVWFRVHFSFPFRHKPKKLQIWHEIEFSAIKINIVSRVARGELEGLYCCHRNKLSCVKRKSRAEVGKKELLSFLASPFYWGHLSKLTKKRK